MVCVLQLTDTHIHASPAGSLPPTSLAGAAAKLQGRSTTETLDEVLAAVAAEGVHLDLVLHTGDVADDGSEESYEVIRPRLEALGAPVLAVPGNHDDPLALAAAFGHDPVPVRCIDVEGWRVVAVNSAVHEQDHGTLGRDALEMLEHALDGAAGPVLIGLHHPPVNVCADPACQLDEATEVLDAIRRHPAVRAVVSGHLHHAEELERHGVAYLLSPSTCLQLRHVHPLPDHNTAATPVGARVLDLGDDGLVRTRVIWAGPS